jgi:hypothetical protein
MTVPSTDATVASVITPDNFVDTVLTTWVGKNKKTALKPGPTVSGLEVPFPLVGSPMWPGTGDVATLTDHIPLVTVEGMPAVEYPKFLVPLAAYTLVEMLLQQPELTIARSSSALSRLVTLVVAGVRERGLPWGVCQSTLRTLPASLSGGLPATQLSS